MIDADKGFQETFGHVLTHELHRDVKILETHVGELKAGEVYLGTVKGDFSRLSKLAKPTHTSFMLYGQCSKEASLKISSSRGSQILVEDLGEGLKSLNTVQFTDKVPATSYSYMCSQYFYKVEKA